jgi:hypothetical protein
MLGDSMFLVSIIGVGEDAANRSTEMAEVSSLGLC